MSGLHQIWPTLQLEDWLEGRFAIAWSQHGGSGLGVTWHETLDLDVIERDWLLERIDRQRRNEARALRGTGNPSQS